MFFIFLAPINLLVFFAANGTITLQLMHRISDLEAKIERLEKRVIPTVKISASEATELEKIRREIRNGKTVSERTFQGSLNVIPFAL